MASSVARARLSTSVEPTGTSSSRFGSSLASNTSNETTARSSLSAGGSGGSVALSPRHEPQRKTFPYRTTGLSQTRAAALVDIRYNLRPVNKRQQTERNNYSSTTPSSISSPFVNSSQLRNSVAETTNLSPISEARETERAFAAGHHHNPMIVEPSDATMRLMAARSARRNATVAKFRQTMAESQALIEPSSTSTKQQISPTQSTVSASSLLLRMPSLSRRSTTEVTKESLNGRESKDRPQSLIETTNGPLAHRRLSIVKETNSGSEGKIKTSTKTPSTTKTTTSSTTTNKDSETNKKDVKPSTTKNLDESQFNAVVQFKPQSFIRRKISENSLTEPKPVPGSWERTPREQFISQNKHLIRTPQKVFAQLCCRSAQIVAATIKFNVVWKEQQKRANVLPSVNNNRQPIVAETVGNLGKSAGISSITAPVSNVKNPLNQQPQQQIVPPVPPHRSQKQEQNQQQKEQLNKSSKTSVPLILPDKSILEQFVQNKRDILDQLHEEAEEILSSARDLSTCGTTNKLLNPLKETTTTISSLPESKRNSQMLIASIMPPQEAQSLNSSYHSAIQDDLFGNNQINIQQQNRQRKPIDLFGKTTLLTTHQFEKPKSLFEEKMQKQAFQLHEKAVNRQNEFNNEINNLNKTNLRRKSATNENADLAQTFVNQTQKPYQQEQRYAAHISLSGRQSTASCESGNSGSLDTENRQMIDQARYKHNQQRNKFKEAIDYLDHIFEDFQRESDLNQQQKEEIKLEQNKQQMPQKRLEVVSSVRPGNVKSAKEAFEKVAAALANERSNSKLK
uniref:Uncharacterized protein n=1 Tax=Meloidogyne javanica TaxID=6303 RepID=A0A915LWN9_MELJA